MVEAVLLCPVCGEELFQVYFGDKRLWWRCMSCNVVFQFQEYRYQNGELVRSGEGYNERITLGKKLAALRTKAIAHGMQLLSEDEVLQDVRRRRGERLG